MEDTPRAAPSTAPIFIGGTGRSGTTVFTRLLDEHSAIKTIRWESRFIVARKGLLNVVSKNFKPRPLARFLEKLRGRWYRRTLYEGTPREYEAGLFADVTEDHLEAAIAILVEASRRGPRASPHAIAAEFVDFLFSQPVERADARRWCEKTPANVLYADQLHRLFPDMRLVHIIRDGRDVVSSMLERGFWPIAPWEQLQRDHPFKGPVTLEGAVHYWVEMLRLGREIAARVPTENYLELRLEDLVEDREATLRRICDFLDEDLKPPMLAFDLSRSNTGRWRHELNAEQLAYFTEHAGHHLAAEGYSLTATR